ncbi:MAG: Ig-like domain-containing protein [Sedimentisphaerales bacterium]|nr:Ig-like domain-containing protein [Sedimentisphaerales bacterium]
MSRTFRQHIRMALFNSDKAAAITKMEQKLKAEAKARAIAEEKLRLEIATRTAAEQKVEARAQQKLLTQHRRYSALAARVEAQAKAEIAKIKTQTKEALEKLDSFTAELNQKEKQLKEVQAKLEAETLAKVQAQETLKAERQQHRKAEAKAKENLAKVKAQAKEKIRTYTAALSRAQEKLPKAEESRYGREDLTGVKEEYISDKNKEQKNIDAQPIEKANIVIRICRNIVHPKSKKTKVALFSILATLSVLAIALGVSVVKSPPVAQPGNATTREDESVSITLMASDPDRDFLTYNILKGPSHGNLSGKAPKMTYTPASNYNGPDSFTFSISEGKAGKNEAKISITVLAANDAPIAYHRSETIKVNKSLITTLTGSDVDGDILTFNISKEPEHGLLSLDLNFNNSGKLIYRPEPDFEGQDTFSFKLNDGKIDSTPATVSIDVCPNLLPVAESQSVTTPEDTPVQIDLIGNDPDSDPLSYIMVSVTSHGSLRGDIPNLTYTPDNNFNGSDSFSFKVNDGIVDSHPATVSITISSVNDPPVARDDAIVIPEDTPAVKTDVLANDTDIDNKGRDLYLDTLTVTAVTHGKNGSVTINPDGTLSYSPNANFYGSDEFTYTVRDNKGDTDTAKVNVTVNMANDAPVIISAPEITANVGILYTYEVKASDPDLNDTLTYSLITKPADMTINPATGLIEWTPAQVGENEVAVKVADSNSVPTTDTQSFTIMVSPPPPKKAKITPRDNKAGTVQSSDDKRFGIRYGSYTSYDFSNDSVPADVVIKSVVVFIEHFEEERFSSGKLEWAVGTGWPTKPVVWASIEAPVHEDEKHESVDSWDITSLVDTRDKLNSFQLQIKNNDVVGRKNTFIDHIYLVVEWD